MSYLYGRIAFERFDVSGRDIKILDQSHVKTIDDHAIGKTGAITADGVEVGFTAGRHVLDLDFSLEKNIINDALVFGLRVDTNKLPSDLMRAYAEMELAVLLAESEQEFPSRKMKQQAKEAAEERLNDEAKSGKFRRMKQFPVMWDIRNKVVYFGGSNQTAMEQFANLFKEAFGRTLTRRTSGHVAYEIAQRLEKTRSLEIYPPPRSPDRARPCLTPGSPSRSAPAIFSATSFSFGFGGTSKIKGTRSIWTMIPPSLA